MPTLSATWINRNTELTVLAIHGIVAERTQLEMFWDVPYNILAPDLPGHGASGRSHAHSLFAQSARGIAALLKTHQVRRYAIIGYSLGGFVTQYLVRGGANPEGIVLIGTAASLPNNTLLRAHRIIPKARAVAQEHAPLIAELVERYGDLRGSDFRLRGGEDIDAVLGYLHELQEENFLDANHRLRQPALIIHGTHDRMVPVSAGRTLAGAIPLSTYLETQDNHLSVLRNPLVRAEIQEFLSVL